MHWHFIACQKSGAVLEDVTPAVTSFKLEYRLNQPVKMTLSFPADDMAYDDKVAKIQSDGFPTISDMRVIRAYRGEPSGAKVLRGVGYVLGISDKGEGDEVTTEAKVYGPEFRLSRRHLRLASGMHKPVVSFTNVNAGTVVETLIDRTNAADMDSGTGGVQTDPCGVTTTGNVVDGTIPAITRVFEYMTIGEVLNDLCLNVPMDYEIRPVESTGGALAIIDFLELRGTLQTGFSLGWGVRENNASRVEFVSDSSQLANMYHAHGGRAVRKTAMMEDMASIDDYGAWEDHGVFENITIQAYLDSIANTAIMLRKTPKHLVNFTPQPEAAVPWDDFDVGDTFWVGASARLRGGFQGIQRCYGFDIEGDGSGERLSAIYTTPETA